MKDGFSLILISIVILSVSEESAKDSSVASLSQNDRISSYTVILRNAVTNVSVSVMLRSAATNASAA